MGSHHTSVLSALRHASQGTDGCVLATVVRTEGSAYRGAGARMLVRSDGTAVGLVSGGCLESDLIVRATDVLARGRPEIVIHDARSPDDLVWGLGLGCEGLVEILLEPLSPRQAASVADVLQFASSRTGPAVVATIYRVPDGPGAPAVGARVAVAVGGGAYAPLGEWGISGLLEQVIEDAGAVTPERAGARGWAMAYDGAAGLPVITTEALPPGSAALVSFEVLHPPFDLIVCGTGPDADPVARLAIELGWHTTVVGLRPLAPGRAAGLAGARIVECASPGELGELAGGHRTAAIIMSHHYEHDLEFLGALLSSSVQYIGVLGPRRRTDRLLADLSRRDPQIVADGRRRIFGPAGLDIGGDDPQMVALALVAEVAAVMHGRSGSHLRDRAKPIHDEAGMRSPDNQPIHDKIGTRSPDSAPIHDEALTRSSGGPHAPPAQRRR